jgi:hypothetical protein
MDFNDFPHIQRLTETYPEFSGFFRNDPCCTRKVYVEDLLQEASRLSVSGYEKIASDTKGNTTKIESLLSEILTANLFANLGASVKLLKDNEFNPDGEDNVYTPDLLISFENGLKVLAEVTSTESGLMDIHNCLSKLIKEHHIPFEIQPIIGEAEETIEVQELQVVIGLGKPGIDSKDKYAQEKLSNNVIEKAIDHLKNFRPDQSGIVIFRDKDTKPEIYLSKENFKNAIEFQNFLMCFEFKPTHDGKGYVKGCIYGGHLYDGKQQERYFLKRLKQKKSTRITKKNKYTRLPKEYRSYPFLIIYHIHEFSILPDITLSALTGSRNAYSNEFSESRICQMKHDSNLSLPTEIRNAIDKAYTNGWKPTLDHWDYGQDSTVELSDRGVYLNEDFSFPNFLAIWWLRCIEFPEIFKLNEIDILRLLCWHLKPRANLALELSGVLILRGYNLYNIQWLPNPFSRNAEPRLQDIGLPLDKLGTNYLYELSQLIEALYLTELLANINQMSNFHLKMMSAIFICLSNLIYEL